MIAELLSNAGSELAPGTVHVWRFACQQEIGQQARVLSAADRTAAARFVQAVHRSAYEVQHAMVRLLLARYTGIAAADLVFARGPRGKPALVGAGDLELNLSHAHDVALLAVARGNAVGVDIERLDANIEERELGRIVLAPDENAPSRAAFMRIWCRKEASLKATGVGLVDDLTSVSVARDRAEVGGTTVFVGDLQVGPEHAAALATTLPVAPVGPNLIATFTA